jgi:hypothetical protein
MLERFTRQADSTHVVIYGNGCGECLCSYWASERIANAEAVKIAKSGKEWGFDPNPRVDSLAELDALEGYEV